MTPRGRLWLLAACLVAGFAGSAPPARGAELLDSRGTVIVMLDEVPYDGATMVGEALATETLLTTEQDGEAVVKLGPGLLLKLLPGSKLKLGPRTPQAGVDTVGRLIDQVSVGLTTGKLIVLFGEQSEDTLGLRISTPRGNLSPVLAGSTMIHVVGADPPRATLQALAVEGGIIAVTTRGEQVPVAPGLAAITRPDERCTVIPCEDVPGGEEMVAEVKRAAGELAREVAKPPAPVPTPTPEPTPEPTPAPEPAPASGEVPPSAEAPAPAPTP